MTRTGTCSNGVSPGTATGRVAAGSRGLPGMLVVLACVALSSGVTAQNEPFRKTFPYAIDKSETLDATVGPVKISSVSITNLGRGYGRGGFGLGREGRPSELSTTLRITFQVDNPIEEEWDVTFQVEFLDKAGTVIDRVTEDENYEDEQDELEIEHPLLEYVLPLITEVRVTLQGRRA